MYTTQELKIKGVSDLALKWFKFLFNKQETTRRS